MGFKIYIAAVFFVVWFGFIGPACMSSRSDLLCAGWPLVTFGGVVWVLKQTIAKLFKGEEK